MGKPVAVQADSFQTAVLEAGVPVLVDFWAEWCGPCKMVAPILDKLSGEYDGRFGFTKVDVDEEPELAARYHVRAIPTLLIFRAGQLVDQIVGAQPESALRRRIEAALVVSAN